MMHGRKIKWLAALSGLGALALGAPALGDGACCFIDGMCIETVNEAECESDASLGGTYMGDGTTCATVDCTGACCELDGTCTPDVTLTECFSIEVPVDPNEPPGFFRGVSSSCDSVCAGACCLPDGSCVEARTQDQCEVGLGGIFLGTGSTCPGFDCYAVVQGDDFGPRAWFKRFSDGTETYTFDKFDSALGDLVAVRVDIQRTLTGRAFAENQDPQNECEITAQLVGENTIEFPQLGTLGCMFSSAERAILMGPAGSGDEFAFFGDFVFECTPTHEELTAPADLAFFTGAGDTFDVSNFADVSFIFTGGCDADASARFQGATGSIRVTYLYLPPCTGEIGDFVWNDLDGNGCQDPGEPGIPDVRVRLFDCDDQLLDTDFTDADGLYLFEDLCAGDYKLRFDQFPAGFSETIPNAGCDFPSDENDSDCIGGMIPCFNLPTDSTIDHSRDCGALICDAELGDFVWRDDDMDGCQGPGEPGIPGATVRLFQGGVQIDSDVTDASGLYRFTDLCAGEYVIRVTPPPPPPGSFWVSSPPNACGDDTIDSDCEGGAIGPITLSAGEIDLTNDCGFYLSEDEFCGCEEKGSVLIFSKVELRWDAQGNVLQDTFIELTNDYPEDVLVLMYFINGDPPLPPQGEERPHPGWNWLDNEIELTSNEPTYWSALTGLPKGVSPFTVLDPGFPPGRPANDGTGERYLRGYIIAWAVNPEGEEIRWNHLAGLGTLVNYGRATAWSYVACSYRTRVNVAHGEQTGDPGVINLDGSEFATPHGLLLLQFQAVGSAAWSGPLLVTSNTDVTLHPIDVDVRQETAGPVITKAHYDVWNENELKLSGAYRCITCWDQTLLSQYGVPNHFLIQTLQTDHGKARIDGLSSQLCPGSTSAALLGLAAKFLAFDIDFKFDDAGGRLVGMGCEAATILFDTQPAPPENPDEPLPPLRGERSGSLIPLSVGQQEN